MDSNDTTSDFGDKNIDPSNQDFVPAPGILVLGEPQCNRDDWQVDEESLTLGCTPVHNYISGIGTTNSETETKSGESRYLTGKFG